MKPSTTWRSLRANTAGIDCTWKVADTRGFSSTLTLTSSTAPSVGLDDLLQDGPEGAAGPAPRRPQVDDDRDLVGADEDVLLEGGIGDIDHARRRYRAARPRLDGRSGASGG